MDSKDKSYKNEKINEELIKHVKLGIGELNLG
jgi:hypothetical protein